MRQSPYQASLIVLSKRLTLVRGPHLLRNCLSDSAPQLGAIDLNRWDYPCIVIGSSELMQFRDR